MLPTKKWLNTNLPLIREQVWEKTVAVPKHEYYNVALKGSDFLKQIDNTTIVNKKAGDVLFMDNYRFIITSIDHELLFVNVELF